ncbi:Fe-Mn family superoxide dismutase [Pelomonas saccharophila]|uniref:superoxide dismutase n=1 Tax=Roseateles saccharophilus TaxID=304 RepID=A0ABU1YF87_ROSSA|nr:Fe-Mn family superoxide dismutase [Roseateles saccharophilus]MDR7267512.1 Fe-Mn family superoxide dismutase [Roseateles saccharophilus]
MDLQTLPLPFDPTGLRGLSEKLIVSHHQNNYAGAAKRLNAIRAQLAGMPFGQTPGFQLNGLKREELIATNSVLLHELYFAGLGGDGVTMAPAMQLALDANFGSFARWREEFVACAKALGGGSGWMLLVFQPREGTLMNQWAADHTHAVAGGVPILALDMYEHAYHLDHGAAAGAYVDAFMANINWGQVYERYQLAVYAASDPLAVQAEALQGALVLDVRRQGVFAQATSMIPGARWRDPAEVATWAAELPADRPVVVYCVYGHEIGRSTAMRLRAAGRDARFLSGGIDGWAAAGRAVMDKQLG